MQGALHARKLSCWLVLGTVLTGCGKQSTPLVEVDVTTPSVADASALDKGLPLLAVPGPDDANNSTSKGKVTRAAATGKSGPTLLPKGLFGKKGTQPEPLADDAAEAKKLPEKGSPAWLLSEIQRVRMLPLCLKRY